VPTPCSQGMHRNSSEASSRAAVVAWSIITASLILGVLTRFIPLLHYIDFIDDQAYNAFVNAHMRGASSLLLGERDPSYSDFTAKRWYGNFPTVGPPISGMRFFIAPLYYYIVFPLTILSSYPTLQAIPNAVFSFLTIPLVIFSVYRLLVTGRFISSCHTEELNVLKVLPLRDEFCENMTIGKGEEKFRETLA
jgi:hypothetical protein